MGNQSQQSDADNRQQGFGGGQPEKGSDGKELRQSPRPQPHQSGDRNANESMRDEGPERAPKK